MGGCFTSFMNVSSLNALMTSLANCLDGASLKSVVELRASPEAASRMEWLAERANEGELTAEERAEYESCIRFGSFLGILQSIARKKLGQF